jgi:hypothetical protein
MSVLVTILMVALPMVIVLIAVAGSDGNLRRMLPHGGIRFDTEYERYNGRTYRRGSWN